MKTWIVCMLVALAGWAPAQVRVAKDAGAKSGIDLSGISAAAGAGSVFKQVLEADLLRSGWFARASAGTAQYLVRGSAAGALSVSCQVQDRSGAQVYGKSYSVTEKDARKVAHKVADEIIQAIKGRKGMNSGRIAVIGKVAGRKELFVCDCDGANMLQITHDKSISVGPYMGPGGRVVSYTSFAKNFADAYIVDLGAGNRRRIASFPGSNLAGGISPDGGSVALVLSKDGNPELYVAGIGGTGFTRLTRTPRGEASPCWSPDGRQIAYVSDQGGSPRVFVVDRAGGAPTRVSSGGSQNVAPDWGPNGLIAFSSAIGGRFQICVVDPATKTVKQLTSDGSDYEDPTWAPDGRHILCARSQNYRSQLVLVDLDGDPPFPLTTPAGDWYSPAWSR
jgi:TolB protein